MTDDNTESVGRALTRREALQGGSAVVASTVGLDALTARAIAQSGGPSDEISGVVEDDSGPIDGATVVAVPHDTSLAALETTTDANGEYIFDQSDLHEDSNLYHVIARDGTESDPRRGVPNYPFIAAEGAPAIPDSGVSRWEWEQDVTDSWGDKDGTDNTSAGFTTDSAVGTYAKSFDGSNDYVAIPTITEIESTGVGTLTAWINTSDGSSAQNINRSQTSEGSMSYAIYVDGGTASVGISADTFYSAGGTTDVADGNWHHVCGVIEPSTIRIYVDGLEESSTAYSGSLRVPSVSRIGAHPDDSGWVNADIDHTDVYDKTLSPTEVNNLYNTDSITT